jgi:nitroreductase
MSTLSPGDLLHRLSWRYATKRFDPARPIADAAWAALLETLRLAPSSFGLQPWRFVVVDDPAVRRTLRSLARDQAQLTDAARLLVIQAHADVGPAEVQAHADRIAGERGDRAAADTYRDRITTLIAAWPAEARREWAVRQAYIALGSYLTAAAVLGVDACPMEGVDRPGFDRALGSDQGPWRTLVAVPTGHRAADDPQQALAKVRHPPERVLLTV